MNAALTIEAFDAPALDHAALDDDAVNDIVCRQQVAREMRLSAQGADFVTSATLARGADLVTSATLARAADLVTSNDDTRARAEVSSLPSSTLRTLLLAFCDALAAGDWVTVTDALDAWERSGEMEPAMWVLTGDASDGADIREMAS